MRHGHRAAYQILKICNIFSSLIEWAYEKSPKRKAGKRY